MSQQDRPSVPPAGGTERQPETLQAEIVRATGQIGSLTLLSRVLGLVRDMIIGSVFGAGAAADAFFVAFRIPNLFRRLVGEGAAAAAFVPVIAGYLATRPPARADRMLRAYLGTGLGVLLVVTGIGILLAEPIAGLFAPGYAGDKLALTVRLTRATFVYLFFVGGVALAMGILHALRHFTAPAFAPVLFNVAVIACALTLAGRLAEPVMSLAWGVVIGGACQLLWQVPALVRHGVSLRLRWQPGHPALRRMGVLLLPLVFGAGIYQLNLVVGTQLASLLAEGSVARLWYASRLFEFPVGVFVAALGTAVLPSLAEQAHRHDTAGLRDSLGFALRLVNVVMLPAAVGLAALAVPVTTVLFHRGAFSAADALATAAALQGMAPGLWAVAATRQITACLYALGDTRTPVWGGVLSLAVNVVASLALMGGVRLEADAGRLADGLATAGGWLTWQSWGIVGLALAGSLAALANFFFQAVRLSRRVAGFAWRAWVASLAWSAVASLGMFFVLDRTLTGLGWRAPAAWFDAGEDAVLGSTLGRMTVLAGMVVLGLFSFAVLVWPGAKQDVRAAAGALPDALLRRLPQRFQPGR